MKAELDPQKLIDAYNNGQSLNSIARAYHTYATSIKRILEKNGVELRHDPALKGSHNMIKNGEKLIEWAKVQGRLVTKAELAKVVGTKRLSPAYFVKYPELGQYVSSYEQKELSTYIDKLYNWLRENNISYKPNDKTALEGIPVQALLLEEYENIIISIDMKAQTVSKPRYNEMIDRRIRKAKENGYTIVFLKEEHFEDLDTIKELLESAKER